MSVLEWIKLIGRTAITCFALAGSSCTALGSASSEPSLGEVLQKYGPPQAHWISKPFRPDSLLVMYAEDPALHGGDLFPLNFTDQTLPNEDWLNMPGLKIVRIPITPRLDPHLADIFGPRAGEPSGVYQFEYRPKNERACAPYLAAYHARYALAANTIGAIPAEPPGDTCIVYTYMGSLDLPREKYVYVIFGDSDFARRGYNVEVQELRNSDGVVLARAVSCFANYWRRQIAGCGADTSLQRLLSSTKIGGASQQ